MVRDLSIFEKSDLQLTAEKYYRKSPHILLLWLCIAVVISCNPQPEKVESKEPLKEPLNEVVVDTVPKQEVVEEEPELVVTYHIDSLATAEEVDSFRTRYSDEEQKVIFSLNRMDSWRLKPGKQLLIPDTLTTNFIIYSPFPKQLDLLDSIPKSILINQRVQGIALYEHGNLIHWGPVSSGKETTPTPNGLHYGNHRAKRKVSTVNPSWILPYYFNFMNFEGVGVHQYSMPGYPASHACVRLFEEDAKFIYEWADQWQLNDSGQVVVKNGTPFMVFGEYDFEGPLPWVRLAENEEDNFLNAQELDTIKSYAERYFQDERNFTEAMDPEMISQVDIQ